MSANNDIQCIWDAKAVLGEGPMWAAHEKALYWVDIKGPAIHRIVPSSGERSSWPMPEKIGCLVHCPKRGFLAALQSGIVKVELGVPGETPKITHIQDPEPDMPNNRFNDGKIDSAGQFIAGTMDDNEENTTGSWYRLDPSGQIFQIDTGYKVTNGPAIDEVNRLIYLTDSAAQTIYVAQYLSFGEIANKRVFKQFGAGDGYPDGMTIDGAGNLWVAFWDGACLRQFTPGGDLLQVIKMPVPRPTSIAIGPDPDCLYVTSASIGLDEKALNAAPLSGGLFTVKIKGAKQSRQQRGGQGKAAKNANIVQTGSAQIRSKRGASIGENAIGIKAIVRSGLGVVWRHFLISLLFAAMIAFLFIGPHAIQAMAPHYKISFLLGYIAIAAGFIVLGLSVLSSLANRIATHAKHEQEALKKELMGVIRGVDSKSEETKQATKDAVQDLRTTLDEQDISALRTTLKQDQKEIVRSKVEMAALKSELTKQQSNTKRIEDDISHRLNVAHGRIYEESQKFADDLEALKSGAVEAAKGEIRDLKQVLQDKDRERAQLERAMMARLKVVHRKIYDETQVLITKMDGMRTDIAQSSMADIETIKARIEAQTSQLAAMEQTMDGRVDAAHGRIYDETQTLKTQLEALEANVSQRIDGAHGRIHTQTEDLRSQIETSEAALSGRIDAVHGRIFSENREVNAVIAALRERHAGDIEDLIDRLGRVETMAAAGVNADEFDDIRTKLSTLNLMLEQTRKRVDDESKRNSTGAMQAQAQIEARLSAQLQSTQASLDKALSDLESQRAKLAQIDSDGALTRESVKAEIRTVFQNIEQLKSKMSEANEPNHGVDAGGAQTRQILSAMQQTLDKLAQKDDAHDYGAKRAQYQDFNRDLRAEHIETFENDWLGPLGLDENDRSLAYLADRIIQIENTFKGRLATTIEDAVLRTLVALSVKKKTLNVLEIGTLFGVGLAMIYDRANQHFDRVRITAIDPMEGYYGHNAPDILTRETISEDVFTYNMRTVEIPDKDVNLIKGLSADADVQTAAATSKYDVLVIDGDHSYDGVKFDFETYGPMVYRGGYIIIDDYCARSWPEIVKYVDDELRPRKDIKLVGCSWRTAVFKVKKSIKPA